MTTAIQPAFVPSDIGPRTMSTTPMTHTITTGMAMNQIIRCSVPAMPHQHKVARLLWAGGAHTTVTPAGTIAGPGSECEARPCHDDRGRASVVPVGDLRDDRRDRRRARDRVSEPLTQAARRLP